MTAPAEGRATARAVAVQAVRAAEDVDALLVWLQSKPARQGAVQPDVPEASGTTRAAETAVWPPDAAAQEEGEPDPRTDATGTAMRDLAEVEAAPLRLNTPDWLFHRLIVTGAAEALAGFAAAAAGAGTLPWRLDLDRMEEDLFHLLVAPQACTAPMLSLAGARVLVGDLRAAVGRRQALAVARIGVSRACPFDLHTLIPVPDDILRLGPDHPAALAWLWANWGTTQELRQVASRATPPSRGGPHAAGAAGRLEIAFWSADWTPWRALACLAARWPALCFDARPDYDPA